MNEEQLLVITSFPPRKCGIATYSADLIQAIDEKYTRDFTVGICALLKEDDQNDYPSEVKYFLKTEIKEDYTRLAEAINEDKSICAVYLQHEFGLYGGELGSYLIDLLEKLKVPVITTFHTILSDPSEERKTIVQQIAERSAQLILMTKRSASILQSDYQIDEDKITIIPHGTHLIKPRKIQKLENVPFPDKTILSTFGLISEGKSIETALDALPSIADKFPNVLYLIIGKTHPEVLAVEGEKYRDFLRDRVKELKIDKHVLFINKFLALKILLEYLQRTDIYLFTSKDPQQAVSGTLAYAMSAGCPVVSTPIPHSLELTAGAGINFDFQNSRQLADAVITILSDSQLMEEMWMNGLHNIRPTSWQNAAIAHIEIVRETLKTEDFYLTPNYKYPAISLGHIKRMTTDFGMIQFAKVAEPDKASGYTLDDNARALIAITKHFDQTGNFKDLHLINTYLEFILFCQQEDGSFLNYVTIDQQFFEKNRDENLEDANGRAIWALGEFLDLRHVISFHLHAEVETAFLESFEIIRHLKSPRAMAFSIKGLNCYYQYCHDPETLKLITQLADNLVSKYRGVSNENWQWYEPYLTYANAVLPEAMLIAGQSTNSELYKSTAKKTFDFLLSITHENDRIMMISNIEKHVEGKARTSFGEQPIEYAYTILALDKFSQEYGELEYVDQLKATFNWFLGDNHLHQIIYNPCTGGCYDGLEEHHVNLNQGAESTVSYLLSRLTMERYI
ncbi:glycosyltransferase [Reichenbachiella ulvae]|uniref:Glycosyltransferase n=1 Tax=Reichenbachiella ulvae TaxID=2980104 RepID=A0ABT3CRT1_9BACT|nr:glycosyltransferase [Reichenbachiella ulvae]MCV9385978.1 glycosyltransferase [Reichenbachiella ulvae]